VPDGVAKVTTPESAGSRSGQDAEPITFTLEVDQKGDGNWTELESIDVPDSDYVTHYLPDELDAIWLRLKTSRDCVATAFLHQTTSQFVDGATPEHRALFAGLASAKDEDVLGALVYAAKRNRNLRVVAGENRFFDFTKAEFEFRREERDPDLKKLLRIEPEFTLDQASVIVNYKGQKYRLPKGDSAFDQPFGSGWPRASREVESERHLANIHGTFYEVPLITNGAPPAWNLMRPVSSHSKQITDFCSWNGLLVLAGVRAGATDDGHVFADSNQNVGLWFGGIDDLWKLGKPVGRGGPWEGTCVKANLPSDPYLMTGYDRKSVEMWHNSGHSVTFTLQVDIDGNGFWVDYDSFPVPAGEKLTHEFPTAFSACWIRVKADHDTTATARFVYQ
jgi:hypothetical protein